MKYYAQFWHTDLAGKLSEACGDRALINLDGRITARGMRAIAADTCKKRGYLAYTMLRGTCLRDARQVGPLVSVEDTSDLETVSEVINARKEALK